MDLSNLSDLSRISEVVTVGNQESANEHLKKGWVLLSSAATPMRDGGDTWTATTFVLGRLGRDALVE